MDLAFLAKRYDTVGGTERNLFELTRRLARRGHRVTVYCLDPRRPAEPGVEIRVLRQLLPGRFGAFRALSRGGARRAMRGGHDVVISFARAVEQDIVRNGGGTHRVYLDTLAPTETHAKGWLRALDPYHRSRLAAERLQYSPGHYRRIVAIAPLVKQDVIQTYGVPPEHIRVIPNGVNPDLFHGGVTAHRAEVRARHGIPADVPVVLFVGNGFQRKGLEYLLAAAAPLAGRGLHVLVAGTDPHSAAYAQQVAALGTSKHVCFAGEQSAIHEHYGAADLFSLPSIYEPFGQSTLEALACGLPVLIPRTAGAAGILPPRLAELALEDPRDIPAFTDRLARLLDPALRATLRADALETSRAFTLDANADAFEQLCREVMEIKRRERTS